MTNNYFEINQFKNRFFQLTNNFTWEIQGFIDQNDNVLPIDSDTKVLSTVFERFASPALRSLAAEKGYVVETANQTTYPDFTLTKYGVLGTVEHRIALDIKSTYIEPTPLGRFRKTKMTLGSYNSFIRNNTKNILYPYHTYHDHWVLGFVYIRNEAFEEYTLDNIPTRGQIRCPYSVQSVFIREKVDLTGIRAGSGNTKNIGSIEIDSPRGFESVNGPFTQFRDKKGACDFYWANYETAKEQIFDWHTLYNHPEMARFR
ncbi:MULTISPECIES: type II restriction endonuclease [Vibrio harveyi group]|uniref:type II restriction endonuclease n=1 Tax=Vibrio harveyi group TaxID=717610 RepID=UPI00112021DE|nr:MULTISPECIES: type II restriction endonuclease [Vibrio harveyi group]ELA8362080.1 restriction endonuclease [Vibrio alginolyticus]ELA8364561.1 restriction endonuclease [Vibrio alginolyticus]KAB5598645.1 restriction endonuclease [Vibrio parahaemolyticus]MCR9515649.1 restriction endonuclease [Vibrio alginolyticus]MCR9728604.1 restriction endonuclease [Vibrio parahaemolyticus]